VQQKNWQLKDRGLPMYDFYFLNVFDENIAVVVVVGVGGVVVVAAVVGHSF